MSERWRPVVGYEGFYEVSDLGNVRRVLGGSGAKLGQNLKPQPKMRDGRLVALRVSLSVNGRQRARKLHHLVLEAFVGPKPSGYDGCHGNGDPADNRLGNLRWDTKSSNSRDALAHGTNYQAGKTHCPRHHLLDFPNLVKHQWEKHGARACLACHRARGFIQRRGGDLQTTSDRYYAEIMKEN